MDLNLSTDDQAFQNEVRTFLKENLTEEFLEAGTLTPAVRSPVGPARRWAKVLASKGWLCHPWPTEFGGPGWNAVQKYIYELETELAGAPSINNMGLRMVGPVVMKYGTRDQKATVLPSILKDEFAWCQGYSEPGAGSDLASLQTRAVSDGDDYVINGSKIWTTGAHNADKIFCLVRTSTEGKPQEGISFLLFDMDLPGITVKPILTFAGDHELNQVFFDNVRVPQTCRVGEENQGWTVAKYLLEFERGGIPYTPRVKAGLLRLKGMVGKEGGGDGQKLVDDPSFRGRLAQLEMKIRAAEIIEKRVMSALSQGENPGASSSIFKLRGSELLQEMLELSMQALGYYAAPYQPEAYVFGNNVEAIAPEYGLTATSKDYNQRAATIYAGSSEVQRSILAKHVLGL
ncbi:MAG: Acryloyl-CoA reductase (NADH) [Alphaproteobacteria bacterium MarineAlpha4_Bin2]|nr:MAG: Acryloyl-CoA reductase (NADH) [Alphaproteobacteria bacterium MarineAlpha4_Bin2]